MTAGIESTTGYGADPLFTNGAAHSYDAGVGAGEAGISSPTLSYQRTTNRANTTLLANSTDDQYIGGSQGIPVVIKAIRIHSALAGTLTIKGFATPTSAAALTNTLVIAATTVGDVFPGGVGRAFPAGCSLDLTDGTDGPDISVDWEYLL